MVFHLHYICRLKTNRSMIAIADGGSTKADWILYSAATGEQAVGTTGFNPNYESSERIFDLLMAELKPTAGDLAGGAIHYYGAGCWDPGRKQIVANALQRAFPSANVFVYHDLLAAARATCGKAPGIACILGTGSNSVLFDGENEVDNVTNLGFLLGDEGSGSHIGKKLVRAYFYREMPAELHPVIEQVCPNGRKDILDKVYGGGVPAAYLASFTKYFQGHQAHPFVREVFKRSFTEFLVRHVCKYKGHETLPVHFVGSVAFHFRGILEEAVVEQGLHMGTIIKRPIDKLLGYHLQFAG